VVLADGHPRIVLIFTVADGRITAIEAVADAAELAELEYNLAGLD
jgi:hypothetical protein